MSFLSDPSRFRKTVAGLALVGAPLAGFLSCLTDSNEGVGEKGSDLYATVTTHSGGIHTTGLVFMLSAVLTVPAALGLAHLLRGRGATLGHLGAAALLLGAFGHFGYGFFQVLVSHAGAPADQAAISAYFDRIANDSLLLLPLMILVDVGIVLLSAGLLRSRAVPAWVPWATIGAIAVDLVVQFSGSTATWPVTALWAVLTVLWGYLGVRVLGMRPAAWAAFGVPAPAAVPEREPVAA